MFKNLFDKTDSSNNNSDNDSDKDDVVTRGPFDENVHTEQTTPKKPIKLSGIGSLPTHFSHKKDVNEKETVKEKAATEQVAFIKTGDVILINEKQHVYAGCIVKVHSGKYTVEKVDKFKYGETPYSKRTTSYNAGIFRLKSRGENTQKFTCYRYVVDTKTGNRLVRCQNISPKRDGDSFIIDEHEGDNEDDAVKEKKHSNNKELSSVDSHSNDRKRDSDESDDSEVEKTTLTQHEDHKKKKKKRNNDEGASADTTTKDKPISVRIEISKNGDIRVYEL